MTSPNEAQNSGDKNVVCSESPDNTQISSEKEVHEIDQEAIVDGDDRSDTSTVSEATNNDTSHNDIDNKDLEESSEVIRRITTELGPPVIVPRLKRRGLFAQLALVPEIENGKTYQRRIKWYITAIAAVGGVAAPLGSAIFLPSLHQVADDLNSTPTIVNLSIALYMLAMSIFPLWWSSFSEAFGRRSIYIVSFALFVVFNVLSAISHNIAMLIVMRLLAGGASASVQAVGAGTIADIWEVKERGQAMGYFYIGPLCGPLFAPIIGGALAQRWGWRSTMWFMVIFGGVVWILILLGLPETLAVRKSPNLQSNTPTDASLERSTSRVSSKVAQNSAKVLKTLKMTLVDPLSIILYLRFFPIALTIYYAAITFGSLYVLNISIQETFGAAPYNFSTVILGLLYIPNSLGYLFASLFGGRWMDKIMHREAVKAGRFDEKGRPIYQPEDRMKENAWLGACLYPAGLLVYGWTAEYHVHWIVPMIANFCFGVGSMIIFGLVTTMLTEFLSRKSSAGVALNNFVRNIFSCVGTVVASPIIDGIGNGWLFTILSLVSFSSGVAVLLLMKRYGPRWRERGIDH
ncbi:MFS multidrug resistance transporter, putative [Talaromyces stipitatus ATCC 10500]|uniref:MFS multidrug resistance transporter, putative n=1 Tax=Talaromyces stipitatus (strain ATCC 10500 / CBS 375.48 / QM 6759 / NRRL 1006) TaxID=441959 RepID=B8M9D5_TALSN|nr:MFS multidrug resistance transporter, putative [Talaromyces stipitatus ATCC 10500]EED17695.1 MFS multidrug resistance transporter, putative [Talaromyces stipitatus ATCC 10500]